MRTEAVSARAIAALAAANHGVIQRVTRKQEVLGATCTPGK
jgi:hypothetical protein